MPAAFLFLLLSLLQTKPVFDVAVVKPTSATAIWGGCRAHDSKLALNDPRNQVPLGRCVIRGVRVSHLMSIAYDMPVNRIRGGPDWVRVGGDRYDIEAAAADPAKTTEQALLQMLQTLLAGHFKLEFHRSVEDVQGFALVVDKPGKLQPASADGEESFVLTTQPGTAGAIGATITAKKSSLKPLAEMLSTANLCMGTALSPVVDKTGLQGFFDYTINWRRCGGDVVPGSDGTIPYALKDQLGLKLESAKVPQEFLIIDRVEKLNLN